MSTVLDSSKDVFTLESFYKETLYDHATDPLVLACSVKALADKGQGYMSFDHPQVISNVTDEIKTLAEDIRKYYGKKFIWNRLNGKSLTDFQERALYLLENRVMKQIKDQDQGIYFKLPYFYEEDTAYDEFKKLYNTERLSPLGNKRSNKFAKRLKFLKTTKCIQKNRKTKHFWFADDNKDLYSIQIKLDNELLGLFERLLEENPTPLFETYLAESKIDKLHFYKLYSFKFLKDYNA